MFLFLSVSLHFFNKQIYICQNRSEIESRFGTCMFLYNFLPIYKNHDLFCSLWKMLKLFNVEYLLKYNFW